jgi:hypothetical protein
VKLYGPDGEGHQEDEAYEEAPNRLLPYGPARAGEEAQAEAVSARRHTHAKR